MRISDWSSDVCSSDLLHGLVRPEARAMASAILLFMQNLVGLGLGPLLFGILSEMLKPAVGAESVRYVLYGAAWLGLIPAFFLWRRSEERRVGEECVRTLRSWWAPDH